MEIDRKRPGQRDRLLALLKSRAPAWVFVRDVVEVAGVQYGARIYELRRLGHWIESKPGGGWFRLLVVRPSPDPSLVPDCESDTGLLFPAPKQAPVAESLFGDLSPESRYPD